MEKLGGRPELIQHIASYLGARDYTAFALADRTRYAALGGGIIAKRAEEIRRICRAVHEVTDAMYGGALVGSAALWMHSYMCGKPCHWIPGDVDIAVVAPEGSVTDVLSFVSVYCAEALQESGFECAVSAESPQEERTEYWYVEIYLAGSIVGKIQLIPCSSVISLVAEFDLSGVQLCLSLDTLEPTFFSKTGVDQAVYGNRMDLKVCTNPRCTRKKDRCVKYALRGYRMEEECFFMCPFCAMNWLK